MAILDCFSKSIVDNTTAQCELRSEYLKYYLPWQLLIILIALLLRVALISNAHWTAVSDSRDYHELARNLLNHGQYFQTYSGESPEYLGLTFRAYRMPGYPFVLASIYQLFGWNAKFAMWANILFELITLIGLGAIARKFLGSKISLCVQALFALHVLWTPNLMTESLFTMLFVLLCVAHFFDYIRQSPSSAFIFGVGLTFATFVRPIALCLVPLLLYRGFNSKFGIKIGVIAILPLFLAFSFWIYRNYLVLGTAVVFSSNFGAHNSISFGIDKISEIKKLRQDGAGEVEINRQLTRLILERIYEYPFSALQNYSARVLALFSLKPPYEVSHVHWRTTFTGQIRKLYRMLYYQYYLIYALALVGFLLCLFRRSLPTDFVLVCLSFVVMHGLVSPGNMRFVAPLYPLMLIFVGFALKTVCYNRFQ